MLAFLIFGLPAILAVIGGLVLGESLKVIVLTALAIVAFAFLVTLILVSSLETSAVFVLKAARQDGRRLRLPLFPG